MGSEMCIRDRIIGEANLSMIEGDIKVRKAVDMMYDSAVKK